MLAMLLANTPLHCQSCCCFEQSITELLGLDFAQNLCHHISHHSLSWAILQFDVLVGDAESNEVISDTDVSHAC